MRPKHFYHVSSQWLGNEFQPILRTPSDMAKKEPPTPRLCVCPTIAACFAARLMASHRTAYVYKTAKPYRGIAPRSVWDQIITGEKWLIPPVKLIHVANINALTVDKIQSAVIYYHKITKQNSGHLVRLAQYARANEIIGGPEWEERLINRWLRRFDIFDPERFLIMKAMEYRRKSILADLRLF